jgi:hypothetical protein
LEAIMTQRHRVLILLAIILVAALLLACGASGACYSTYPGCEATAEFIATAASLPH